MYYEEALDPEIVFKEIKSLTMEQGEIHGHHAMRIVGSFFVSAKSMHFFDDVFWLQGYGHPNRCKHLIIRLSKERAFLF